MFHVPAHKQTDPAKRPAQRNQSAAMALAGGFENGGDYRLPVLCPPAGVMLHGAHATLDAIDEYRESSRADRLAAAEARGDWETANTLRFILAQRAAAR